MNKYNQAVIAAFSTRENYEFLKAELINKFNNPQVYRLVCANMDDFMANFLQTINRDFMYSEPIYTGDETDIMADQVACLNMRFVDDRTRFISDTYLCSKPPMRQAYGVTDGLPASTRSIVSRATRAVLRDYDTSAVENSREIYGHGVVETCRSEGRIRGDGSIGADVDYARPFSGAFTSRDRKRGGKSVEYYRETDDVGKTKSSADAILESWRYPSHGATERDDVVGDLVADNPFRGTRSCRGSLGINPRSSGRGSPGSTNTGYFNGYYGESGYCHHGRRITACSTCANAAQPAAREKFTPKFQFSVEDESSFVPLPGSTHALSPCTTRVGDAPFAQHGGEYFQGSGSGDVENGNVSNMFDSTGDLPAGTYNHHDQLLGDPYVRALNDGRCPRCRGCDNNDAVGIFGNDYGGATGTAGCDCRHLGNKLWATGSGFVDESDPAAMKRLLQRRTFRTYQSGGNEVYRGPDTCEDETPLNLSNIWTGEITNNQTPWFEKALYNRHYERDVDEAIGGFERGCINRGYDMSSLYCRIDRDRANNYDYKIGDYGYMEPRDNISASTGFRFYA